MVGKQTAAQPDRFSRNDIHRMSAVIRRLLGPPLDDGYAERVWTRRELNGALVTAIDPVDAEEVARELLMRYPTPPPLPGIADAVRRVVAVLTAPVIREPVGPPRFGLPEIGDVGALASWLNVSVDELDWFADHGLWLQRASPRLRHYRVTRIPKRHSGFRVIEAPKERLATLQRRILDAILADVPAHPAAHGFVRGRSPFSFAAPHSLHDTVIRVDLKHCFEHITAAQVRAVFTAVGYRSATARCLAEICTTATAFDDLPGDDPFHAGLLRGRHVPQGAPTSPALVNLALRRLDFRIAGYAAKNGLAYTRYGDDLALSGDEVNVGQLLWVVRNVIVDEGFTLHPEKVRVMGDHQRQQLAGLVVNVGRRSRRSDFDELKALLHNATRTGARAQNRGAHADFRAHVYGRIGWVATGSAARRRKLLALAAEVDWDG